MALLFFTSGGTGSGLGTAVATTLQDAFGGVAGKTCFCQAVWPHSTGEVILQNYNTLLSIAHLSQVRYTMIKNVFYVTVNLTAVVISRIRAKTTIRSSSMYTGD